MLFILQLYCVGEQQTKLCVIRRALFYFCVKQKCFCIQQMATMFYIA